MKNSNSPKRSPVPLIIGALMILAVIGLKVLSSQSEEDNPAFLFLGILVVVGGFAAVIVYLSIKAAKQRKLEMGDSAPKKKTPSDILMWVFAGVGGAGLLALLWSLCFAEKVNFLVILGELAVFVGGFSVTYNIYMSKRKKGEFSENNDENEGGHQ